MRMVQQRCQRARRSSYTGRRTDTRHKRHSPATKLSAAEPKQLNPHKCDAERIDKQRRSGLEPEPD
jgi:hypothetical protein